MHEISDLLSSLGDVGLGAVGVALYFRLSQTLTSLEATFRKLEERIANVERRVDSISPKRVKAAA